MTADSEGSSTNRPRWKRAFMFLVGGVFCALIGTAILLACLPVSDFTAPSPNEGLDRRARQFEQTFASEMTRVRGSNTPWAIRIREDDLNAWFWTRLPNWVAHFDGSDSTGAQPFLQAALEPDRIRLMSQSMALAFVPVVDQRTTLIQPGRGSALGRLPLPSGIFHWSASAIDFKGLSSAVLGVELPDQESGSASQDTGGSDGIVLPALFPLGDGRSVELLEIQMDDQQMVLVFQTRR